MSLYLCLNVSIFTSVLTIVYNLQNILSPGPLHCIYFLFSGAKYIVLRDGELHIRNAARSDSFRKYRCLIKDLLTGNVTPSVSSGQLIVTGSSPLHSTHHIFFQSGTLVDSYYLSFIPPYFPWWNERNIYLH